ncbi:hypothetical protein [Paenibacillus sp.]|uniref:hypothetical protein n=1 Tax=Paenibacillus sp. TaxID=58172 RepID=UPI002D3A6793|nr:hypothetical protein [Paenibacillus sp.]HZG87277.1 hypothetical protein [Paenibacillus sp.]
MTKSPNGVDKNLSNVVASLDGPELPALENQQRNQDKNDRRHQDRLNVASQRHEAEQNHQAGES